MVASPEYLATGAGLNVLRQGGSAVDAAIATNATLAVVAPYKCGMGGDLFALLYTAADQKLVGLNGSGRAPAEASPQRVRELAGGERMPQRGPLTVTVPGCVEAWGRLHKRYGRLPLRALLADAITYAAVGFPVTREFSLAITRSEPFLNPETPACETFLPDGSPPREGEVLRQPRLARTLEAIAQQGPDAFYRGELGQEVVRSLRAVGGLLSAQDLAEHTSSWVEPLSTRYRDVVVYELPPNSQGMVALMMLTMLRYLPAGPLRAGGAGYLHLLAEVARLAYADRESYLTDPDHMSIDPHSLLSDEYGRRGAARVRDEVASAALDGSPGDTAYLCTADADGNLVSLIESNYLGIGSGIMAGETGIMLQNRGASFSLDPQHANVIAPRKRTMHTLMPAMAFKDGKPWLVFGTMGGSAQAQIHVQLLTRLLDQGLELDEALAAPRFDAAVDSDDRGRPLLQVEAGFPLEVLEELRRRGHTVTTIEPAIIGHAHAIEILANGVYCGAADPRTQSLALGY